MIRYNLNGEYLVPFKDEVFTITKRAGEVGKLNTRHGDYSTTFKVPVCVENSKILRYTPELNNYNDLNNFKKYVGYLEQDGNIISTGYYQVVEFNQTEASISLKFYGGNTDWFELLKGRYINKEVNPWESLNTYLLDEFIHFVNFADITASFGNTDNYIYFPYAYDYNIDAPLPADSNFLGIDIDNFMFGFYQHTIFKKIFDSFDIKLEGTLFKDPSFYSTVITTAEDLRAWRERDASSLYQPRQNKTTPLPTDGSYVGIGYDVADNRGTTIDGSWNGDTYTSPVVTDNLKFIFQLCTKQPPQGDGIDYGTPRLRISYTLNGVPQTPIEEDYVLVGGSNALSYNDRYSIKWVGETIIPNGGVFSGVKIGDTFKFELTNVNSNGGSGDMEVIWGEAGQAGFSSFINVQDEDGIPKINAEVLLPDTSQPDFIKDVLIRHGAITQFDSTTRTLTIDKFEDIEHNIPNALDWSPKIDLSRTEKVDYVKLLGKYGQSTYLRYTNINDKDPYVSLAGTIGGLSLGDGTINIDNDMIPREAELYTSPYSASAQVLSFNDKWYMPYIPTHKIQLKEDNGSTVVTYDPYETNNRVLIVAPNYELADVTTNQQDGIYISNDDGAGAPVLVRFTQIPFAYFTKVSANALGLNTEIDTLNNSLSFENRDEYTGNALIPKNYQLQEDILNKPLYVSLFMNINSVDMSGLNHLIPIYIEYKNTSGYFYVDSIEQYRGDGTPTQVNLVKIS